MKNKYISLILAFAGAIFLSGCDQKQPEQEKPQAADAEVNFTVGLNDVGAYGAEILVRHDGKPINMWYGFNTTDLTTDVQTLIGQQLSSVNDKSISMGTSKLIAVDGLAEKTAYRYIAFGVTPEGEVYGNPGFVTYTTDLDLKVTFTAEVSDITISSAKVSITHGGNEALTYAGFVTTDMTGAVSLLTAEDYKSRIGSDGHIADPSKLMSGTSCEVTVEGLESDTPYRYIVYGLMESEAGGAPVAYGNQGVVSFTTLTDYDAVVFKGEATATTKTTATISVTYTGANSNELEWYGFNTADLTAKAEDLIAAEVASGIDEKDLRKGREQTVTVEGLTLLTDYRYIVTGIKDGVPYGTPADIAYQTADEDYDQITFSAALAGEPGVDNATIKVTHDGGKDKFQWIYVLTKDTASPVADLLPKPEEVKEEDVHAGQDVNIDLTGLDPKTSYRFIVSGYRVDASGAAYLYGTPGELKFSTDNFYKLAGSWKISFDGKTDDYEGYPFKFTNTVSAGGSDGKYFFTVYEAADVAEYADMDAFLTDIVPDEVLYLEYLVKTYPDDYPNIASLLTDKTSSEWFNLGYDSYVVLAIGLSDEGEPTGKYAYLNYTNEPSEAEKAAYNKWLGKWKITRGRGDDAVEDMLTVSQREFMKTYDVLGFEDGLFDDIGALEAEFDPATGNMKLYAQVLGQTEISGRGTTEIGLYGYVESTGYFYTYSSSPYKIADISLNADGKTAAVTPGSVSAGTLDAMRFYGKVISTGGFIGWNTGYTYLPNTLTRPSDSGSAAYNAWLGSWSVPRNGSTDTWVIRQDVADYSYTIEGIESLQGRVAKATFEASTGELVLNAQKDIYKYTDNDGTAVSDHIYGHAMIDGSDYYITGSYPIFRGKLSGSTATLSPGTVSISGYDDPFDLIGMQVYAWDVAANKALGSYLDEGEEYTKIPNTLTKTGASSVRSSAPARARKVKGAAVESCATSPAETRVEAVISNAKRIRR